MPATESPHRWRFFRAGGFDQVRLDTGADLLRLDQLDQKLWVALACPIAGLEFDPKTAALIDTDHDGRIRAAELIAAIRWTATVLKSPDTLIKGGDSLSLDALNAAAPEGKQILDAARHVVSTMGRPDAPSISLADIVDAGKLLDAALFNGDGVVIPESTDDPATKTVLNEIADCVGTTPDRCGKPGINQENTDKFFSEAAAFDAWMKQAETGASTILPLGRATAAAGAAVRAVKPKADDYFARCRVAAFDARSVASLNPPEAAYVALAAHDLSFNAAEAAGFPLAQIASGRSLPLTTGLNPAHAAAVAALVTDAIRPLLGERTELTETDWLALQAKLAAFENWNAAKAGATVEKLGADRVRALLASAAREKVNALIARDLALAPQVAGLADVEKLLLFVRDLRRLCVNFVNFKDLYDGPAPALFQVGVLYLDQRACRLCLSVEDAARHAALAGLSGAYLVYCDCVRKGTGEKKCIVAIVSQGDDDNLMVGRNGVFYDRQNRDYDATVTSIVASPISLRQAFWAPYKKLARVIEEHVAKRAAAADGTIPAQMAAVAAPAPAAPGTPAKPLFDPSVIALLSLAVGSLAAGFATVLAFLGRVPMSALPLVLAGIILAISAPSILMAWLKLRRRNLGPIFDANGWAINARALINVPFGERLTEIPKIAHHISIDSDDRFAEKPSLWPKVLGVVFLMAWAYAILNDTGLLFRLTQNWDLPLGNPPAAWKPHPATNAPPQP